MSIPVQMPPLGPGPAWPIPSLGPERPRALEDVPEDAPIDLDQVGHGAAMEALARLDSELVGLSAVKRRLEEVAALLVVDRLRERAGLASTPPTLHMCFTGSPGTGKTTVAVRMGAVLKELGYVRKGHLVTVTRDDLVGQYVGHTAPKTQQVLKRAMGGVLFIDEAYTLYRADNERDYGQEVVELLLQAMENNRRDLVVVMAGYADKMERFFSDVPGLSSRIAHHLDFPDYSIDELMEIAQLMIAEQQYRLSPGAVTAFAEYLARRKEQPRFANGRSVRNGVDRARLRQASRLYDAARRGRRLTKRDLATIEAEDFLGSRVFATAVPPDPKSRGA